MKNIQVSDELHEKLKSHCKDHGMKVGSAAELAIKAWLGGTTPGTPSGTKQKSQVEKELGLTKPVKMV